MKSSCPQCSRMIDLNMVYCPHCGAVHRLNPSEATVWLGRKGLIGAVVGGIVGAVVLGSVVVIPALIRDGSSGSPRALSALAQLGALCGGMLGAVCKAGYEWNRRPG
jgi:hypothetical protein